MLLLFFVPLLLVISTVSWYSKLWKVLHHFSRIFPWFKTGVLYIDRYKIDFDKTLINVTFEYVSDKVHDLVINVDAEYLVGIDKMVIAVKINIPEDKNDRLFGREILRTVVDVGQLMNGVYGNPIIKSVIDIIMAKKDIKPSFPILPVRTWIKCNFNSADSFVSEKSNVWEFDDQQPIHSLTIWYPSWSQSSLYNQNHRKEEISISDEHVVSWRY